MTKTDGFAALTRHGEVIYEQAFTEIAYPNLGIQSFATAVYPGVTPERKRRGGRARGRDAQPTLF